MAFTVGSRGSIIEVMNPQAKNNVVTATNADLRLRGSLGTAPPSPSTVVGLQDLLRPVAQPPIPQQKANPAIGQILAMRSGAAE
jgi:hypothetical protein